MNYVVSACNLLHSYAGYGQVCVIIVGGSHSWWFTQLVVHIVGGSHSLQFT